MRGEANGRDSIAVEPEYSFPIYIPFSAVLRSLENY